MKTVHVYIQATGDSKLRREFERVIKTAIGIADLEMTKLRIKLSQRISSQRGLSARSDDLRESDLAIFALSDGSSVGKAPQDVTYKMGYFWISEKDVILLVKGRERPDPRTIPENFEVLTYRDERGLNKLKQELAGKIKQMALKRIAAWPESYNVACFQDREGGQLTEAIRNAKSTIDVLTTNLAMFSRKPYLKILEDVLADKKRPDLTLRMLTLDPQSLFAAYRAMQLGLPTEKFREELRESLNTLDIEFKKLKEDKKLENLPGRVEIRTYDDFPTQITFMIDEFIYCCAVARSIRSRDLCTIKLPKDAPGVERSFMFHFTTLWTMAKPYGRI